MEIRLDVAAWRVTLWLRSDMRLSHHPGSRLAGALASRLRQRMCQAPHLCLESHCGQNPACDYGELIRTRRPNRSGQMCDVAHPLVVAPLDALREGYRAHELFAFDLTLVANAIERCSVLFDLVREQGEIGLGDDFRVGKGRFEIESIRPLLAPGEASLEQSEEPHRFGWNHALREARSWQGKRLEIEFDSPLRLLAREGNSSSTPLRAQEIDFLALWLALQQRVRFLSRDFGGGYDNDFPTGAENVQVVTRDLQFWSGHRYSGSQDADNDASGVLGRLELRGDLARFLPFLVLGQWLHVGKNADLGQGRFRLQEASE